ncbi:SWI/SNF and RSC complex subunit Ssr1 [Dinochytrium kinnereticum]|nr:SWI/SNF and RSC complex subunit Ssr1 [Dinochytrium kinnereticum]
MSLLSRLASWLLLALVLVCLVTGKDLRFLIRSTGLPVFGFDRLQVRADDENEGDEFLKAMEDEIRKNSGPETKSDLEFSYLFPDNPFKVVVSNEVSELLISVRNTGKNTQTLFAISGAFTHPKNLSLVVRNITSQRYSLPLEPKQEATVPFRFRSEIEAQDIGLIVYIDYFDNEEQAHRAIAFKDLVRITSNDSYFDLQGVSLIVALVAGVYFAFQAMYQNYAPEVAVKKTRPNKAAIQEEIEAKKDVLSDEWIPDHIKKAASSPAKSKKTK